MKKIYLVVFLLMALYACSDDNTTVQSDAKRITGFSFPDSDNTMLSVTVVADINEEEKTITAELPAGTPVKELKPSLSISHKASVTPANGEVIDFTNPVKYTVTAQDESQVEYTVKVTSPPTQREVLIAFYNANRSNTLNWDLDEEDLSKWEGVSVNNSGNVDSLDFERENIRILPPEISNLKALVYLNLRLNNVTELPKEITTLSNLEYLDLFDNNIAELPAEIENLVNLKYLSVHRNKLENIPAEIGNLPALESLVLGENNLTTVPSEIGKLSNLINLTFFANNLTRLPPEIGNLKKLEYLGIGNNQFEKLIPEIGELTSLTRMDINENVLTELPPEIGDLINLNIILAGDNRLTSLPVEMGRLVNLSTLALRNNDLTSIPKAICDLNLLNLLVDAGVECEE